MGVLKITSVIRHTTDANKFRVTFSEAVNTATLIPGNFVLTPSLTVGAVAVVVGSGNTQADVCVGSPLASDVSTIALWQFDELSGPTAADSGPGGYTLTDSGGSTVTLNGIYAACRLYDGTDDVMRSAPTVTPRAALLGDWTVEAAVRWDSGMGALGDIVNYTGLSSALNAENTLLTFGVDNSGKLYAGWEAGAGVAQTFTAPAAQPTLASGIVYAVAARKTTVGGTLGYQIALFLNGGLIAESSTALTASDGGTSGDMRFAVGRHPALATNIFKGLIDVVRVSSVARTNDAIQSGVDSLLRPFTTGAYSLQVSSVTDAATSTAITSPNGLVVFSLYRTGSGETEDAIAGPVTNIGGGALYITAPAFKRDDLLTFSAVAQSVTSVRVSFSQNLTYVVTTSTRYHITGPSVLTVSSVSFTPGESALDLAITGIFQAGTYVLSIDANTVSDAFGISNTGTASFVQPTVARTGANFNPRVN